MKHFLLLLLLLAAPVIASAKPETKSCSDAEIKKRMDTALTASEHYAMIERCQDDAGFREAVSKGLRVMKKKAPAPAKP